MCSHLMPQLRCHLKATRSHLPAGERARERGAEHHRQMSDDLGPDFDERIGAELDRASPPTPLLANARFKMSPSGYRPLVGRKVALAVAGAVALLMVAATALARSPNPAVWVRTVESVTHAAESSPSPSPESAPQAQPPPPAPVQTTRTPEQSHESPEPSGETDSESSPPPSESEH